MSWEIREGDALERLCEMPDESVHCCVTSPPYWGLRDYGTGVWQGGRAGCDHSKRTSLKEATITTESRPTNANHEQEGWRGGVCGKCGATKVDRQLGLEKAPELYVSKMTEVFREVRRVLRSDGTLWLNIGDSYAASGQGAGGESITSERINGGLKAINRREAPPGLKPKDLYGIPWLLAFALRSDGWYLRQDIIWSKPNPMPESVTDRCTKAHEYLFLLSKSARYYYDQDAILEECSTNTNARLAQDVEAQISSERANGGQKTNGNMKAVGRKSWNGSDFESGKTGEIKYTRGGLKGDETPRNDGERWNGNNGRGFERKLAEPGSGIKSNSSFSNAVCCLVEKRNKRSVWEVTTQGYSEAHFATFPPKLIEPCILAGCPEGGTVLDPFAGAGTTGLVSTRLGRNFLGIELNPEYVRMAEKRITQDSPLFNSVSPLSEEDRGGKGINQA